ncbi:alpha-taxilin-like protein isoform X2 [Tasmannia lanceolata]|uniref:alpha-taxilin-like protein isoform X2 n=1 Tax=Tasmannia lanceolata TaxID=3420 RepID=UPI004063A4D0
MSEMENSPANQLPEADSLPDGFVESSTEPLVPRPGSEPESPDYKDTILALGASDEQLDSSIANRSPDLYQTGGDEIRISDNRGEKAEKPRTFPVPLSEKDGSDSAEVAGKECMEQREGELGHCSLPEDSRSTSSRDTLTVDSSLGRENADGEGGISKQSSGCLDQQAANLKESSAPESAPCPKNKKLECISEGKRKTVKRSVKSEKELLDFTLKYQQVITERDAAIAVREKLESLCRELQRQNKMLMDECKRVSTEGQNMRQDLSTKFHDAIKDVSIKLDEQKDECLSQLNENEMLRKKLKHLGDQYAVAEQQFQQKLKQKMLELQLADLKLQQQQEKSAQEQSQMHLYAEQVSQLLETEKNLRLQLAADGEKFQQFQEALVKSNEVFETFKQEMEKMAKSMKELKKENNFLKSKSEKSDVSLIELVDEEVE